MAACMELYIDTLGGLYLDGSTDKDLPYLVENLATLLQTDNHASTPTTQFFTGRMPFLPPNQQRQSTKGNNYIL